jgi:pyruvate dehydrogenase (quinone)
MAQTVSDHIIQRLYACGVRTIYGYPGDGINGLIGALDRAEGRPLHPDPPRRSRCIHGVWSREIHW